MEPFAFSDLLDDSPARRVIAKISVLSGESGGHDLPGGARYRPNHNFGAPENREFYIGQVEVPPEGLRVGESRVLSVTFLGAPGLDDVLYPGRRWRLQEGGRWVATGELVEVLP
jgi:translation elongation factor EF-Tu-like GTPase